MFENDDNAGLDLDDEFLNVVFDSEEVFNNNKLPLNRQSLNTASPDVEKFFQDKLGHNENCHKNLDSSSSKPWSDELHIPGFSNSSKNQYRENVNFEDQENKRKSSPPSARAKRERKFPGPAGLLPDRKSSRHTPMKLDKFPGEESPTVSAPEELCSQGRLSGSTLAEGPWQNFLSDLGRHVGMLDVVNVASIKRKAAARCFVGRKVPLLAGVLHHLDVSSADPCIILRDTTGEIHGTLHREVWQQFAAELVVGSVLVVRNVGLLSTGLSSRRHYLNITANNLAAIYSANPEKPRKKEVHSLTPYDYEKTIEHWRTLVAPPRDVELASPSTSLFNTSLPSSCSSSPAQSPQLNVSSSSHSNGLIRPGIPHGSNVRPNTFQNNQGQGSLPINPAYSKTNQQSRPLGKNLFSSNCQNPIEVQSKSNNSLCSGRPNQSDSSLTRNSFSNSFLSNSRLKPNTSQNVCPTTNSFKFDPVVLRTPAFAAQSTLAARHSNPTNGGNGLTNSPRIILSQSSQLSVEDRSVVESVFEGIDADSLFDDDDF